MALRTSYKIYTDGSLIRKNGKVYAGYGYYIPQLSVQKSVTVKDTNKTVNRAELKAVIDSVKLFSTDDVLDVYTDSRYCYLIFTTTGVKYKNKGFVNVVNRDLVEEAVELLEKYSINMHKIKAHTNLTDEDSVGNKIADKLAVSAAKADMI